jgi:hypothetical protein
MSLKEKAFGLLTVKNHTEGTREDESEMIAVVSAPHDRS